MQRSASDGGGRRGWAADARAAVAAAQELRAQARAAGHRRLLVLSGGREWAFAVARRALQAAGLPGALWLTDQPPADVDHLLPAQAHKTLGRDLEAVVFDAHCGLDPDAFGAVSGAITGGGLMLLLCPPLGVWPQRVDPDSVRLAVVPYRPEEVDGRFIRRLTRVLQADRYTVIVEEGGGAPPGPPGTRAEPPTPPPQPYRTADQQQAVEAVRRVATGHRRRPVVLLADRGRGKSAAFGLAAGQLLADKAQRLVVTGPRINAVDSVFQHAADLLPQARLRRGHLQWHDRELVFVAPDELARNPQPADLLLVDEAAALPGVLLETLLKHYSRIAFASTVHGYEGTGRGFTLRFRPVLDRLTPRWRELRLHAPVRWAPDDPLEALVFEALLLNAAAAADDKVAGARAEELRVERLDRDRLVGDEPLLEEVFGLLVQAHYRTRPFDLRHMLDGPNLQVYAARYRERVVGTALVSAEGALPESLVRDVLENRRRPHGHLVPESLAAHLGLADGARLRTARVIRIAIHPALQGRGLGSRMLAALGEATAKEGFDLLASSFGATPELLRFWRRQGLWPVRVGAKRSARSGAHSVMVARGLSAAGRELVDKARLHLADQLPQQLADPLKDLEADLVVELLQGLVVPIPAGADAAICRAFVAGRRSYEDAVGSLWRSSLPLLQDSERLQRLSSVSRDAVVKKILQCQDWSTVAEATGLAGRRGVLEVLRQALGC